MLGLFIIAGVFLFFLFEPILVWSYGWKQIPRVEAPVAHGVAVAEYQSEIEAARSALRNAYQDLGAPAISVAVGRQGRVIWSEAMGFADWQKLTPVTTDSQFRIGSTSKALTSALLGRLLDQNKIDIDLTIDHYLDYFPSGNQITARQLLSHSAGIRDYGLCFCFPIWEYYNTRHFASVSEAVEVFADDELLFQPGTRYQYSSYGYTLLSGVMESATGVEFLQLMRDEVLSPLNLNGTGEDQQEQILSNLVDFYDIEDGQYKPVFAVDHSIKWAGGGYVSTPSDLVRLGNALLAEEFVQPQTRTALFEPQKLSDGEINREFYALGWRSHQSDSLADTAGGAKQSLHIVHHGGVAIGSLSFLLLVPEQQLVISVVANRSLEGKFPIGDYAFKMIKPFVQSNKE